MQSIHKAALLLKVNLQSKGDVHEDQSTSDAKVQEAQKLLKQARTFAKGKSTRKFLKHSGYGDRPSFHRSGDQVSRGLDDGYPPLSADRTRGLDRHRCGRRSAAAVWSPRSSTRRRSCRRCRGSWRGSPRPHETWKLIEASGAFALHLVDESQLDLVWRFGLQSSRDADKFAGLETTVARDGKPDRVRAHSPGSIAAWRAARHGGSHDLPGRGRRCRDRPR